MGRRHYASRSREGAVMTWERVMIIVFTGEYCLLILHRP